MQLTLAQGHSVATMLAVAAAAVLLAGAFYCRAFGTLPLRQWRTLLVLRAVAILLVVMLLFRPVLSYQNVSVERPALIFLLDTSASMGIADDASRRRRGSTRPAANWKNGAKSSRAISACCRSPLPSRPSRWRARASWPP